MERSKELKRELKREHLFGGGGAMPCRGLLKNFLAILNII